MLIELGGVTMDYVTLQQDHEGVLYTGETVTEIFQSINDSPTPHTWPNARKSINVILHKCTLSGTMHSIMVNL